MSSKPVMKPLAAACGAAFMASLAASPMVSAAENPFAANELTSGYMNLAGKAEGKCGEGKCGEGKCGEGKKEAEGKCGEGKCGEGKKEAEGKCGEGKCGDGKKEAEGKCGEGKCGAK